MLAMRPKVILKKNYKKINWNMRFVHLLVKTTRSKMNKPVSKKKREKIRERRVLTYIKRKSKTLIFDEHDISAMFEVMMKASASLDFMTKRIIKYANDFSDIQKIDKR